MFFFFGLQFRTHKVIYRRYAGLFFSLCVDITDNELAYLECIHLFVEILDHFFSNVCELDLVFNFHKVPPPKTSFFLSFFRLSFYVTSQTVSFFCFPVELWLELRIMSLFLLYLWLANSSLDILLVAFWKHLMMIVWLYHLFFFLIMEKGVALKFTDEFFSWYYFTY